MNAWRTYDEPLSNNERSEKVNLLEGYFKRNYDLKGKDWIKSLPEYERKAFIRYIQQLSDHGRMGGKARARNANRDELGRFI
jgi:hypothetical protein